MKKIILATSALFAVTACVNPERVAERTLTDDQLTCEAIKAEQAKLTAIRAEADKGTSVSGKNVAAAVLFWPAAIGNYANATSALEAVEKRETVLVDLYKKKRC